MTSYRFKFWIISLSLLAVAAFYFGRDRLEKDASRLHWALYQKNESRTLGLLKSALNDYFSRMRRPAALRDLELPVVPANSGVQQWRLMADSTVQVALNAHVDKEAATFWLVPVIQQSQLTYQCYASEAVRRTVNVCQTSPLITMEDVQTQLQHNATALKYLPALVDARGDVIEPGQRIGSAYPHRVSGMAQPCGATCLQPQACKSVLRLACAPASGSGPLLPSQGFVRGDRLASLHEADRLCQQDHGPSYQLARSKQMGNTRELPETAYWIHNDLPGALNCWASE